MPIASPMTEELLSLPVPSRTIKAVFTYHLGGGLTVGETCVIWSEDCPSDEVSHIAHQPYEACVCEPENIVYDLRTRTAKEAFERAASGIHVVPDEAGEMATAFRGPVQMVTVSTTVHDPHKNRVALVEGPAGELFMVRGANDAWRITVRPGVTREESAGFGPRPFRRFAEAWRMYGWSENGVHPEEQQDDEGKLLVERASADIRAALPSYRIVAALSAGARGARVLVSPGPLSEAAALLIGDDVSETPRDDDPWTM